MDSESTARNLGIGQDELLELLEVFLEASRADLEALEVALEAGEFETAADTAHSLKGAALNLELEEIARLARDLEMIAKSSRLAGADSQITALRHKLEDLDQTVHP